MHSIPARVPRGERKARRFIDQWRAIGGGFVLVRERGKLVLGLTTAKIPAEHREEASRLALFGIAYPRVYGTVARLVREEGLADG